MPYITEEEALVQSKMNIKPKTVKMTDIEVWLYNNRDRFQLFQ